MRRRDVEFIGGKFFETDIPKENQYLFKYYTTDLQVAFLRYWFFFKCSESFQDYTGFHCTNKHVQSLEARLLEVVAAYESAKKAMDLEQVWKIESGKYKFKV